MAMAEGSSIQQDAKQQLQYLRTYIQPLMRAGWRIFFIVFLSGNLSWFNI